MLVDQAAVGNAQRHQERYLRQRICGSVVALANITTNSVHGTKNNEEVKRVVLEGMMKASGSLNFRSHSGCPVKMGHFKQHSIL